MFNFFTLRKLLLAFFVLAASNLFAQQRLNQLIIASGGAFSNPNDFVELATFNPGSGATTAFGQIRTQSVQDALVDGNRLYVTATDSLVCFNLDTYQRMAAAEMPGLRYLHVSGDLLFVSMQYPLTENFVYVLDKYSLDQLAVIQQVSDEAASMVSLNSKIYVAVPGSWTSTVGKMAVLDANDGSFIEEIDFQEMGAGIHDLFVYNGMVVSVNRSAWGTTTGVISFFDPTKKSITHCELPYALGKGIAVHQNELYLLVNDAVGVFNLESLSITNPSLLPNPGSASFINYADVAFDPLNERFYATTTDYFSMGLGFIYNKAGVQVGTFDAGISAEALALDYRTTSMLSENHENSLFAYPNPTTELINFKLPETTSLKDVLVYSVQGDLVLRLDQMGKNMQLNVSGLKAGFYLLKILDTSGKSWNSQFIKH